MIDVHHLRTYIRSKLVKGSYLSLLNHPREPLVFMKDMLKYRSCEIRLVGFGLSDIGQVYGHQYCQVGCQIYSNRNLSIWSRRSCGFNLWDPVKSAHPVPVVHIRNRPWSPLWLLMPWHQSLLAISEYKIDFAITVLNKTLVISDSCMRGWFFFTYSVARHPR